MHLIFFHILLNILIVGYVQLVIHSHDDQYLIDKSQTSKH
jgi:hypothetical protein